jgi:hypothetical protein
MACQTFPNIGAKDCKSILAAAKMFVFIPLTGSDGTKNSITLALAKTLAGWVARYDEADAEDRFYPTPIMENVANERAATEFETLTSGIKIPLRKGARTITAYAIKEGFEFLAVMEKWEKLSDFGFIAFDADGNILYKKLENDTKLYPMAIQNGSFTTNMIFPTDSAVEKQMIQFDVASYEKDSCLRVLGYEDLTDFNPLSDSFALINATVEASAGTTTSVTFAVTDLNGYPVENLAITDFYTARGGTASRLYNVTDSAAVTITGLTEPTAGNYVATFSAETASDVIRITPVKSGYDITTDTQILS